jgi:hypothetical protein
MVPGTKTALDKAVDELLSFDDKAFESYKRVVASSKAPQTVKVASDLGGLNVGVETGSEEPSAPKDMAKALSNMWSKGRR